MLNGLTVPDNRHVTATNSRRGAQVTQHHGATGESFFSYSSLIIGIFCR
jgi:hypothetical protein